MKQTARNQNGSQYHLDHDGRFIIEDYIRAKPFSNFFPGIAGLWGIPMWVFYVNRGQCLASFGIESKDKAILEFQSANKAYRLTSLNGFRTFLKIRSPRRTIFYEPFQPHLYKNQFKTKEQMAITSHDMTIEETNGTLGLHIQVNYFTMPEEPYAALVRRLTVTNLSEETYEIEAIDGLPAVVPFGLTDWLNKHIGRTVEAWVKVRNLDKKAPYYHLNVEVSDTPVVRHIKEGNFYFAFEPKRGKARSSSKAPLLKTIVEAACIFGSSQDFIYPEIFFRDDQFKIPALQQTSNRTPAAMSHSRFPLKPGQTQEIVSLTGFAHGIEHLNRTVQEALRTGFIENKAKRNKEIIDWIKNFAFTQSAVEAFDLYCAQTFLDNVLRGGLPISIKTEEESVTFNVFSRKHGDLERDYNHFMLSPTYFSQGNGSYRDVNQNRRNDIWFNQDVGDNSIINFLNLIQADGYNPLVIKGTAFFIHDHERLEEIIKTSFKIPVDDHLRNILKEGFQPGELLQILSQGQIKLKISPEEFLAEVLGASH